MYMFSGSLLSIWFYGMSILFWESSGFPGKSGIYSTI